MHKIVYLLLFNVIMVPIAYASDISSAYPNLKKCCEISKAFIASELALYDKATIQARITEQYAQFQKANCHQHAEEKCHFRFAIERTFPAYAQDPLAKLVMQSIEDYEENQEWSWPFVYRWKKNSNNSRSLWCRAQVNPEEIQRTLEQRANT